MVGRVVVDIDPVNRHKARHFRQTFQQGRVARLNPRNRWGIQFLHQVIGRLLPASRKVAVGELVAVQALVFSYLGVVENRCGRRRSRPMCTSLGATPVVALTELL